MFRENCKPSRLYSISIHNLLDRMTKLVIKMFDPLCWSEQTTIIHQPILIDVDMLDGTKHVTTPKMK